MKNQNLRNFTETKKVNTMVRGSSRTMSQHYSATGDNVMKRWLKRLFVPPSFFPPKQVIGKLQWPVERKMSERAYHVKVRLTESACVDCI